MNTAIIVTNALLVLASLGCIAAAVRAIRRGRERLHGALMGTAVVLQAVFLVLFVLRFVTFGFFSGPPAYEALLIAHEPMAVITVPLVLAAALTGLSRKRDAHRDIVAWALPIWVFGSVTGVAIAVWMLVG